MGPVVEKVAPAVEKVAPVVEKVAPVEAGVIRFVSCSRILVYQIHYGSSELFSLHCIVVFLCVE